MLRQHLPHREFRPGFEDMLKFLSKGDVQVLIARHRDRLTRNAEDSTGS
jgi:DNA invertase Pin-like site-specific DNA recombinase